MRFQGSKRSNSFRRSKRRPVQCLMFNSSRSDSKGRLAGVTVFLRRLCRFSKHKQACRACVRSCARPWRRVVARGRLRELTRTVRFFCFVFSWSLLYDFRYITRVIIHRPLVSQKPIRLLEIDPASGEPAQHILARHVVASLFNSSGDSPERETW